MRRLRVDSPSIRSVFLLLAAGLAVCCGGGGGPSNPSSPSPPPSGNLGPTPVPLSPINGAQVTTDNPAFTVQNAQGYDHGVGQYRFEVVTQGTGAVVASLTVASGTNTTVATFAAGVPRGMNLAWRAIAQNGTAQVPSELAQFKMPAVACESLGDGWAKSVVSVLLPFCPQFPNIYNDPNDVLGPYNAGGFGPNNYFGFLSLGDTGHVVVDMQACAVDAPGDDIRVFQAVGSEPVTLYVGGTPNGPFVLVERDKRCGERIPGNQTTRYCDFDLSLAEVQEARYFKLEDGEHFPCPQAGTPSEGADIDAVRILRAGP